MLAGVVHVLKAVLAESVLEGCSALAVTIGNYTHRLQWQVLGFLGTEWDLMALGHSWST